MITKKTQANYDWYQMIDGTKEEVNQIKEQFDIPKDFLSSGLDKNEIARFENYQNDEGEQFSLLVIVYPYREDTQDIRQRYQIRPVSFVFSQKNLIISSSQHFEGILEELDENNDQSNFETPTTIVLELFWSIARHYIEHINAAESLIVELEASVLDSSKEDIFQQLMGINRGLINYLSGISGNQEAILELKKTAEELDQSASFHSKLHDVLVEQKQAEMMIKRQKQYLDKINDILSNVVNNNMNKIMKLLTLWSIILTIPTIITGLWGMNVPLPGEGLSSSLLIISIITIVIMAVIYWLFKRNKWF